MKLLLALTAIAALVIAALIAGAGDAEYTFGRGFHLRGTCSDYRINGIDSIGCAAFLHRDTVKTFTKDPLVISFNLTSGVPITGTCRSGPRSGGMDCTMYAGREVTKFELDRVMVIVGFIITP